MLCLIEGHSWIELDGKGVYRGTRFNVCDRCGKTVPIGQSAEATSDSGEAEAQMPLGPDPITGRVPGA